MFRALRKYFNAALIGFIVTFVIYLFVRFDPDDILLGIVISLVGGAVVLTGYVYLGKKFAEDEPELYDREGNLVGRDGKMVRPKT